MMAAKIRRILVALDVSPASLAAMEAAAGLAVLLKAELCGLFVEDADLLQLSRSPLAREIDFATASPRDAEAGGLERQLRVRAARAQAALERIAARAEVPWSFRVARGMVAREIATAAADADLLSLGRLGWSHRREQPLGGTARGLLADYLARPGRRFTLLSTRRAQIRPPVVVLYDGSEAGLDALLLAADLAGRVHGPLKALLVGDDDALRAEVAGRVDEAATDVWMEHLRHLGPRQVAAAVCRQAGGVLIVPIGRAGSRSRLGEEHLQVLLKEVACPVLAVS